MFKKHKLEVRIVKDDARANTTAAPEEPKPDYVGIAEEAAVRLGKKLLIGAAVMIVTTAVVTVLANAADTALQNTLASE